jgi:ABC-type proline/glycine betaine transport system permease subunit
LISAVVLAGGSLFAFNISTSIDNALQVIKTIWVTSDGTTTNPPFVTMDGSGGYVSIGTTGTDAVLNLSGTFSMAYNDSY